MKQLDDPNRFNKSRYHDSKLITTLIVERLAERMDKELVIVNEVSPGPVMTNLGSMYPAYFRITLAKARIFISQEKQLAKEVRKYLHAAATLGGVSHGQYISDYELTP
ncbi:hypothetical protein FGRMN_1382 [Fusarium graminum]|nr:hypothetical protein FGRMN_1382 [Fusarium graminum]